jgi:hypothetical protein
LATIIDHKGIASVLATFRLAVPKHQRSYEWTANEIEELLDDLDGAFQRSRQDYYLGSIVVIADGAQHLVLDGQQRLATVALLLASVADAFERRSEADAAAAVRQLVTSYDIDQRVHAPHIKLNLDDDPYFRTLLQSTYAAPAPAAPESHSLLHAARQQVDAWVTKKTATAAIASQWLGDIQRYLRESVRVIYFGVPDDANAYLIFETMNDRGLDLSIADLLKNYLLGRSGDALDSVLNQWTRTLATLKAFSFEHHFTVFLRHYWASKYEVVREKDLYRNVKTRVLTQAHVTDLADDLSRASHHYTVLLSPDHEYWASSEPTRERMRTLGILGLEQYRPMCLAALAHFEVRDVEDVVRLLEAWNVRLVIVGGLGGGVMEAKYAELGRAIRSGEIKNVKALADRARAFIPGDLEFKAKFSVATVSKVALARYYLRKLEVVGDAPGTTERIPSPSLTLEHVLPERPGEYWPQFSLEEKALYTRRIGNLALLTHKVNSEAKSAPFSEKKVEYGRSTIELTKRIADTEGWTVDAIETRQRQLADLAIRAWPLT